MFESEISDPLVTVTASCTKEELRWLHPKEREDLSTAEMKKSKLELSVS